MFEKFKIFFLSLTLILCSGALEAKILYVPQEYESIQQAIDLADRGDSIKVAPGVYYENLILRDGRNLVGSGADVTILTDDRDGAPDPIIDIDGNCLLTGFTITGARGAGVGHAIMITRGGPFITDNWICDNCYTGIGIHSETFLTNPLIVHNKVYGNGGAGIANLGEFSRAIIRDNDIYSNANAGVACTDNASPLIENNRIFNNGVGVASKDSAKAVIVENMIYRNKLTGVPVVKGGKAIIRKNQIIDNTTVGISVDENSEAWIIENKIVDNAADGVTIKRGSKAYIAFNQIASGISVALELNASQATVLRNEIFSRLNLNQIIMEGDLLESAKLDVSDPHKYSGLGPGALSLRESTYSAGGNKIGGWIDLDRYSTIKRVPAEDLPLNPEVVELPPFRKEIKEPEILPEVLLHQSQELLNLPAPSKSFFGCFWPFKP
ncbi:MAG: right-handed parallel beta-helix repeat-containing protein [Candidatus Schekmanbacteria bacterium]|nr:right-handed parallel beta-helix repeat-containing protein [Candidatus Schekmanbacteria bacterium]